MCSQFFVSQQNNSLTLILQRLPSKHSHTYFIYTVSCYKVTYNTQIPLLSLFERDDEKSFVLLQIFKNI